MRGFYKAVLLTAPVLAAAFAVPRPGHLDVEEIVDDLSPIDEPYVQELPKITHETSGGTLIPIDVQASSPDSDESQRLLVEFNYVHAATVCGEPNILINEEKLELENDGDEKFNGHGLFKIQGRDVAASWDVRCDRTTENDDVFQVITFKVDSVDDVQVLEDGVGFTTSTVQVQDQDKHDLNLPGAEKELESFIQGEVDKVRYMRQQLRELKCQIDEKERIIIGLIEQQQHEDHPNSRPQVGSYSKLDSSNSLYNDTPNGLGTTSPHGPLKFILPALLFVCIPFLIFIYHKSCCYNSSKHAARKASRKARREERRRRRRAARKACKEALKSWVARWKIAFHGFASIATDDKEKKCIQESDIESEISELRNAANIVGDLVAMEEGRSSERVSFETVLPEYMSEAGSEKLPSYSSTFGDEEESAHGEDSVVVDGFRPRRWTPTSSSAEGSLRSIIADDK